MSSPIAVPSTIWSAELPQTPVSEGRADELLFNLAPGIGPDGPTLVLAGRYLVKSPILDYYGGQLPAPIRVVAVNTKSGEVYSEQLTSAKSPPVFMLVPDGFVPAKGARSQGGRFNVDLPALLSLPPQAASYHVFLWLDQVLSRTVPVALEANPQRRGKPVPSAMAGRPLRLAHRDGAKEPDGELVLSRGPEGVNIEGVWGKDLARGPAYANNNNIVTRYPLAVLAFGQRDRHFVWTRMEFDPVPAWSGANHFKLDLGELTGTAGGGGRQRVFVVAMIGNHRSKVLVLEP
jgi:hypothetical protein